MSNYTDLAHCKATLQEMERDLGVVEARVQSPTAIAAVRQARDRMRDAIEDLWVAMQEPVDARPHDPELAVAA